MESKSIRLALAAMSPLICLAEGEVYEGYWESSSTGVGAYWWNAESWRDGIIPGRYVGMDSDGNLFTNGNYGATAYFGTKSASYVNPETFDSGWEECKLLSISNLVFFADKFPQVGQSQWFYLYLEQGGGIYVRDTCTKAPTFKCHVSLDGIDGNRPFTFENDAVGTTMKFDYSFSLRSGSVKGWAVPPFRYGGRGSIQLAGAQPVYSNCRYYTDLFFTYPGKLVLTGKFENTIALRTLAGYGKQTVEIAEGAECRIEEGGLYENQIMARTDLDFTGTGTLMQKPRSSTPYDMRIGVDPGCNLNIGCALSNGWSTMGFVLTGGGLMKVTGRNVISGPASVTGGSVFETDALGNAGEASPFGLGSEIKLSGGGTVRYTGAGDATDRRITVSSGSTGILEQRGSGRPVFAGPVSASSTSTLVLSNDTAVAAEYSGCLDAGAGAPNILKLGSGEWILSGGTIAANSIKATEGTLVISNPCALVASRIEVGKDANLVLGCESSAPEASPGSLTVYGAGEVKALWPSSLPAAGVSLPGGAVVSAKMPNWSWADVLAYANANPQTGWSAVSVDTSDIADGSTFGLSGADVTGSDFALGHTGANTMNLDVPDAVTTPVALIAREGTLRVSGEGSLTLSRALATSDTQSVPGKIEFDGLAGGVSMGDGNILIGGRSDTEPGGFGEIKIKDTEFSTASGGTGRIVAGAYGKGILKTDSDLSCIIDVGIGKNSTAAVQGEGTVWQTGGVVSATNGIILGSYGIGCYRISGGKLLNCPASRFMGHTGGQGILVQSGGEVEFTGKDSYTLGSYGGFVAYQTGGICTFDDRVYLSNTGSGSAGFSSSYTVAGEDAVTYVNDDAFYMGGGRRTNSDGPMRSSLNLNGGVFRSSGIGYYPGNEKVEESRAYVNFDGGVLESSTYVPLGSSRGYPTIPDRVTVFGGGATINVTHQDASLPVGLSGPYGNSVVSVPVPESIADRDFASPPYIEIFDEEGDGDGATAFADVNPETRRISRIIVTSPGWGYTKAVARFNIGYTVLGTSECGLGVVNGGGFTKEGTGSLELLRTNTYHGATIVKNGTLKLGADDVLPANTFVEVEGGTLDLAGFSAHVAGISVTGGTVINGTVTLSGIVFDAADQRPYSCDCPVEFAQGAKLVLRNVGSLGDGITFVTIADFTGGVTGFPIEVEGLSAEEAKRWRVVFADGRIRLSRVRGTAVILR